MAGRERGVQGVRSVQAGGERGAWAERGRGVQGVRSVQAGGGSGEHGQGVGGT